MNNQEKAELYDRFLAEYHRLDNQINLIKMNKIDLNNDEIKEIDLLNRKKSYIMGRISELN